MSLSFRVKIILGLMLIEVGVPALAILFALPGQRAPAFEGVVGFTYVIPIIWIGLFALGFTRLRWAVIGAIPIAIVGIIMAIPAVFLNANRMCPFDPLIAPFCPFALSGLIVSIVILPLSFKVLAGRNIDKS